MFYLIATQHVFMYTRKLHGLSSYILDITVKSDRINAIRKQYDAFLEEDRKRKDRNEFILERLDKMRSCTAVVPVRLTQTTNVFADLNTPIYEKMHPNTSRTVQNEISRYTLNQVHNPNILTSVNEEALVKELSKKYILIPKHQRTMDFEYKYPTKSSVDDVNDWRSKYNILEELKKGEKEEEDKYLPNKETHSNKIVFGDDNCNKININDRANNSEFVIKANINLQEFPNSHQSSLNAETDINTQNIEIEKELFDTTKLNKHIPVVHNHSENEASECDNNIEGFHQPTNDLTEKEKIQAMYELECKPKSEENGIEEMNNNKHLNAEIGWQEEIELLPKSDLNEQKEINELPIQSDKNPENNKNEEDSYIRDVHNNGYSPKIEQSQKSEVNCESKSIESELLNNPDTNQSQIYEDDVQTVTKEEISYKTTVIDNQETHTDTTENADPQIEVQQYQEHQTNSQQEYENTVDEAQIQDFEAEQNNMFYSEQAGDYTYGETGTADNTTVEYANNEGYELNENYAYYEETPNNQAYSNDYEATPQNQAYSNEINEHEESTEQYDPNYQNQYENYGQEQPQPEAIQEYTAEEYDTQQNFDQAIYEESNYNAVEEVQHHLDTEEGYTKPVEGVEGNLDDIDPKEEMPKNPIVEQEVKVTS